MRPNTWRKVFGYADDVKPSLDEVKIMYRRKVLHARMYVGYHNERIAKLNWAMAEAEKELS